MNERIKQLWEESQQWNGSDDGRGGLKIHESVEKFAKLIIDECLNQCYNRGMNDELYEGQLRAAEYIEQHFGVSNE